MTSAITARVFTQKADSQNGWTSNAQTAAKANLVQSRARAVSRRLWPKELSRTWMDLSTVWSSTAHGHLRRRTSRSRSESSSTRIGITELASSTNIHRRLIRILWSYARRHTTASRKTPLLLQTRSDCNRRFSRRRIDHSRSWLLSGADWRDAVRENALRVVARVDSGCRLAV